MHIVWWILAGLCILAVLVGLAGTINPDSLNKDLKEGTTPWTRKSASRMFIVSLTLVIVFSTLAINQSQALSKRVTKKVNTTAKTATVKEKSVKKEETTSKKQYSVDSSVSDQYLMDFLTFMDQFHNNLLQEVKQDQNPSEIAVFLAKGNAEGWKQYDKINSQHASSTDSQVEKRIDVLYAWQSLFELDMDYDSYLTQNGNVNLKTIEEKETTFLQDYDKAKSHFDNKTK